MEPDEESPLQPSLQHYSSASKPRSTSCLHKDLFPWFPARYGLVIISCLGFMIVYALRVNLSMAIVVMVNSTASNSSHLQYNWTSQEQGWVLSSFFMGYLLTQIPGGYLASKYGGRHVFGTGVLGMSILTMLTPIAAELHIGVLIALRIVEGLFEGVTFPSMHALLGKWSPSKEKTIMTVFVYAGVGIGNIVSFPLSAVLCDYGFAGGWPSVFYVFGSAGIVWYLFWLYIAFSSPSTHPRISERERKYIEANTGCIEAGSTDKVPWLAIFTSPPVWSIIIACICYSWGSWTLLTCISLYFQEVLGLSIGKNLIMNGIFSAIPYVAYLIIIVASGPLADFLRKKQVSTVIIRKLFTCTAFFVGAVSLILAGYVSTDDVYVCLIFLTVSVGSSALCTGGFAVNIIDLAPQYTGVLMGIVNAAGTLAGIIAPIVTKTIAHKPSTGEGDRLAYREEWQQVFIVSAEIYIFGGLIYIILAEGERQWWACDNHATTDKHLLDRSSSKSYINS